MKKYIIFVVKTYSAASKCPVLRKWLSKKWEVLRISVITYFSYVIKLLIGN